MHTVFLALAAFQTMAREVPAKQDSAPVHSMEIAVSAGSSLDNINRSADVGSYLRGRIRFCGTETASSSASASKAEPTLITINTSRPA